MNVLNTSQEMLKNDRIEIALFRQQFNTSLTNLPGKIDSYLNKVDNISANIVGDEFVQEKKRKKNSNDRAQKNYLNSFGKKAKLIEQENSKVRMKDDGNFSKIRRSSIVYNNEIINSKRMEKVKIAEGIFKNLISGSKDIQKKLINSKKKISTLSDAVETSFISPNSIFPSPKSTSLPIILNNNSSTGVEEKRIKNILYNQVKSSNSDNNCISERSDILDEESAKDLLIKKIFSKKLLKKDIPLREKENANKISKNVKKNNPIIKTSNKDVMHNLNFLNNQQESSRKSKPDSDFHFIDKSLNSPIRKHTENNANYPTLPSSPKLISNTSISHSNNSSVIAKNASFIFKEILNRCENENVNNKLEFDRLQNHIRISHSPSSNKKLSLDMKEDKEIYLPDKYKRKCFVYGNNSGVFISDGCSKDTIAYSNTLMKMDPDVVYKFRNMLAEKIDLIVVNSDEGYVDLYENKKKNEDEILHSYSSRLKLKHERVDGILNFMQKKRSAIIDTASKIIGSTIK
jgi:hypothetical protein